MNDGDLGFGLDMNDIDDMNPNGTDDGLGLGDLNDIFNDDPFAPADDPTGSPSGGVGVGSGGPGSPGGAGGAAGGRQDPAFRYNQEEPGEQLEILQQPLALGYLVSTAATGPLPRW